MIQRSTCVLLVAGFLGEPARIIFFASTRPPNLGTRENRSEKFEVSDLVRHKPAFLCSHKGLTEG